MIEVELCYNDFKNSRIRICSHFFFSSWSLKYFFLPIIYFYCLLGNYTYLYTNWPEWFWKDVTSLRIITAKLKKKYPFHQFSRIITHKYYFCPFFTYVDICLGVSSHHLYDIQSLNHILLTTSSEAKGVIDQHTHLQGNSHLLDYLCFQTDV